MIFLYEVIKIIRDTSFNLSDKIVDSAKIAKLLREFILGKNFSLLQFRPGIGEFAALFFMNVGKLI